MSICVLTQHNLSFKDKVLKGEVYKIPMNGHSLILSYLLDLSECEIDEWGLTELNKVSDSKVLDLKLDTASVRVEVSSTNIVLRDIWNTSELYQLPTADFKQILFLWAKFLMTPPLDGTKV